MVVQGYKRIVVLSLPSKFLASLDFSETMAFSLRFHTPTSRQSLLNRRLTYLTRASIIPDVSIDPDSLLPPPRPDGQGGHFARRAKARIAASVKSLPQPISTTDVASYDQQELASRMNKKHLPINLSTPGLQLLHLDPPIFYMNDFFSHQECDDLVAAAQNSGKMAPSKIGAGNAVSSTRPSSSSTTTKNAYSQTRTSTSMLLDNTARKESAELAASAELLQSRAKQLLLGSSNKRTYSWGKAGVLPSKGQLTFEGLQVTQYQTGQHFLSHEDAFPVQLAQEETGFQRVATLLIYLNDVDQGGETCFDLLNVAVKPRKGGALLFFPAFTDGKCASDPRTLHTASDAVDVKWVTQQWVAVGVKEGARIGGQQSSSAAVVVPQKPAFEVLLEEKRGAKGGKEKKKQKATSDGVSKSKGFGS